MSWQDYVNAYLVNLTNYNTWKTASNMGEHCAIVDNTDGEVWASTSGFSIGTYICEIPNNDESSKSIQINEFNNLNDAYNNRWVTCLAGGININNEKYIY